MVYSALRPGALSLAACAMVVADHAPVAAQSAVWDATLSNSHWYVPVPQLLAYAAPKTGFSSPIPIGDQTLWSLGPAANGSFTGTSTAQLSIGPKLVTDNSTIQGLSPAPGRSRWCSRRPRVALRLSGSARCGLSTA